MRPVTCILAALLVACASEAKEDPQDTAADPLMAEARDLLERAESIEEDPVVMLDEGSSFATAEQDDGRLVIGKDTRKPVTDTSVAPFSSAVLLRIQFPSTASNEATVCTGTLIAPDAVLTAAHCIFAKAHGGMAKKVLVVPGAYVGRDGVQQTLAGVGMSVSTRDDLYLPPEYDDSAGYNTSLFQYDYAVVRLTSPLGDLAGYRPIAILAQPEGAFARMIAYHSDRCERADNMCSKAKAYPQFTSSDSVRKVEAGGWFRHAIDMAKGASGAGISSGGAAGAPIFALNIAQSTQEGVNMGLLINKRIHADLSAWASL